MVYNNNTTKHTMDNTTLENHSKSYQNLRVKAGHSEQRSSTPNKDLMIEPLKSEPQGKFMIKTKDGLDCDLLGPKT